MIFALPHKKTSLPKPNKQTATEVVLAFNYTLLTAINTQVNGDPWDHQKPCAPNTNLAAPKSMTENMYTLYHPMLEAYWKKNL